MQCNETHLRCFLFFIAQRLVNPCICITRNKLDLSCNALKHILGVFFSLHRASYCMYMHNEKQVRSVMQCTETHLRCFLFTAQRLVIVCICITRNKLDMSMQCNETHLRCFLFIAQRVIACICLTRNKLDLSCIALKHILGVFF